MQYEVYEPLPELQPFIKCFWTLEDEMSADPVKQRIIPDGCMEIIGPNINGTKATIVFNYTKVN